MSSPAASTNGRAGRAASLKRQKSVRFSIADGGLMVMAGLYDEWTSPQGERVRSCTIITTEANEVIVELHDRMPVILTEDQWSRWLNEAPTNPVEAKELLKSCAPELLKVWPVDNRVGNVRNSGADLAQPLMI